jgi:hypothetical protein
LEYGVKVRSTTAEAVCALICRRAHKLRAAAQTASRHLPFNMRCFRTARPFQLFLAMNPCRRRRRRFFGWYARLGKDASE